jgi:outer membrane protein assembly factor BamB
VAAPEYPASSAVRQFRASWHTQHVSPPENMAAHVVAPSVAAAGGSVYIDTVKKAIRLDSLVRKLNFLVRKRDSLENLQCDDCAGCSPGILVCGDAADGHMLWQLRLKGPIWATPVLAGNRLYVVSHDGLVQVVDVQGTEGKLIGSSQIDEGILATPAVADGALYFRSNRHLWKVGTK